MKHIRMMVRLFFTQGLGMMALAALFFASTDVLIKFVSPSVTAIEIAFVRFLIGGIILWPLISSTHTSFKGNHRWILLARGFSGFLCFFFFLKSIAMIPVANAVVLAYTFPMFAALFSFLLLREPVRGIEVILIGVGLIGIYILIDPGSQFNNMGCI
ncbi:MAG: EamA family transporter, partial [Proteobacteria bacterium]|nr:EamA family transporter [Pseudomonadota bacterium]